MAEAEAEANLVPVERQRRGNGFIFQFATANDVHSCMDTVLLENIQPTLTRGKKTFILYEGG